MAGEQQPRARRGRPEGIRTSAITLEHGVEVRRHGDGVLITGGDGESVAFSSEGAVDALLYAIKTVRP